jgi:hypothetical protein
LPRKVRKLERLSNAFVDEQFEYLDDDAEGEGEGGGEDGTDEETVKLCVEIVGWFLARALRSPAWPRPCVKRAAFITEEIRNLLAQRGVADAFNRPFAPASCPVCLEPFRAKVPDGLQVAPGVQRVQLLEPDREEHEHAVCDECASRLCLDAPECRCPVCRGPVAGYVPRADWTPSHFRPYLPPDPPGHPAFPEDEASRPNLLRWRQRPFTLLDNWRRKVGEHVASDPGELTDQLIAAASQGFLGRVESLVNEYGVDASAADGAPFAEAAKRGHTGTMELLLELGADPAAGNNAAIAAAAEAGNVEGVQFLLGPGVVGRIDPHTRGYYPVGIAADRGHIEVLRALLLLPVAEWEAEKPYERATMALTYAAYAGNEDAVRFIIELDELELPPYRRPNFAYRDVQILRAAAMNGSGPVMRALLDVPGIDPYHSISPFIEAMKNRECGDAFHELIFRALEDGFPANIVEFALENVSYASLGYLSSSMYDRLVFVLLAADTSKASEAVAFAFEDAVRSVREDVIKDVIWVVGEYGGEKTLSQFLIQAVMASFDSDVEPQIAASCIRFLEQFAPYPGLGQLVEVASEGDSAALADLARQGTDVHRAGVTFVVASARNNLQIVEWLFAHPIDEQKPNTYAIEAVLHAIKHGSNEAVRFLLDLSPEAGGVEPSENDNALLRTALESRNEAIVKMLLELPPEMGVDAALGDNLPLIVAAREGWGEVVSVLLNLPPDRKVDVSAQRNAPMRAAFPQHRDVVLMLLRKGADEPVL